MIQIREYDQIDPLEAMNLNLLADGRPLTPQQAARLRASDPRVMNCLALYALDRGQITGQIGLLRLPLVSTVGREEIGGIWAPAALPQASQRAALSTLLEEAHHRFREQGLRFSALSVRRDCLAYAVYRQLGYADLGIWGSALTRWESARQPTRFYAQSPGEAGFDLVEEVFATVAGDYLGFARRSSPFAPLREEVRLEDILILWSNRQPVGYALTTLDGPLLRITDLTVRPDVDAAEAVAAVTALVKTDYIQVTLSRPAEAASLERSGYLVTRRTNRAFLLKPLAPDLTQADARRLFAFGADRFLISWLDLG